jgi:hypothetical protein
LEVPINLIRIDSNGPVVTTVFKDRATMAEQVLLVRQFVKSARVI